MSGVLFYNKSKINTDVLSSIVLTEAEEKDVNFYDYDGFRLLSYTNAEALALTALPNNPAANENLIFDEWNWNLSEIKTQINNSVGVINVGAIYNTTDDKTHITCKVTKNYSQASIRLTPTVANAVTVDWGDGRTDTWTSISATTKTHTYTGVTKTRVYDITISCVNGTYSFPTYITGTQNNNKSCTYTDIKLSNKVTSLGSNCFYYCYLLQSISIPNSVTSIDSSCFRICPAIQTINIPRNITTLYNSTFNECNSLNYLTFSCNCVIPSSMLEKCYSLKSITIINCGGNLNFGNSYNLETVNLPSNITSLENNSFYYCYSLKELTIPDNVTSLGSNCFYFCYSLKELTIPSNVTSFGTYCFTQCGLKKIYMKPTTPPTPADSNTLWFNNCVIYVPTGSLSAYQNATYWSGYSSQMVEYNF